MTRNLKALGLALVAVFAMSAVAASAASAEKFTASSYPQHVVATDTGAEDTFTLSSTGAVLTCANESFTGTLSSASTTLTMTPNWVDCKTKGEAFDNVTVTHNGCDIVFHTTPSKVSLDCTEGGPIEVHHYSNEAHTTTKCTETIGSQTVVGAPTYTNSGNNVEVAGEGEVTLQTHGACSFGLTLNVKAVYKYSDTAVATSGAKIDVG